MNISQTYMVGPEAIELYSNIVGDDNPLHTEDSYVERDETFSDENIVHGTLIQGWFSALCNEIGAALDAEVVLVDMTTYFHNPLPVGEPALVSVSVDNDKLDGEDDAIVDVDLRAVDPTQSSIVSESRQSEIGVDPDDTDFDYASGNATLIIDKTVSRSK